MKSYNKKDFHADINALNSASPYTHKQNWSKRSIRICLYRYFSIIHYKYAGFVGEILHSLYLLGLHSSWLLALRGASRWAGNTRWPGNQCLVHLSQHHLWDELTVLCLVITNQLHRWTHNLDKEGTGNLLENVGILCSKGYLTEMFSILTV